MNDDVQAIDEVVVTAIGIKQQKKKLGYTTQQVNTEALDQPGTVNVGNALSGQVAGLTHIGAAHTGELLYISFNPPKASSRQINRV